MALLFAAVAVWFWEKKKGIISYVMFAVFLALSLGIYQTYVSVAMYLILIRIILDILEQKYANRELLCKIRKAVISGICGMVLYYIIMVIVMTAVGSSFSDYMGVNEASVVNIFQSLSRIVWHVLDFVQLFVGWGGGCIYSL